MLAFSATILHYTFNQIKLTFTLKTTEIHGGFFLAKLTLSYCKHHCEGKKGGATEVRRTTGAQEEQKESKVQQNALSQVKGK